MEKVKFRLDFRDERLWSGDRPVRISNKAFQLLKLFVGNPNRLLTKDDILESVWRDLCVSEGLVKEYVHDLRLALGDDPKRPTYIETVRGRGYRFLGGIEAVRGEAGAPVAGRAKTDPPSLAVLPIANLTGEERWARFCCGLGDDLVTDLARYPDVVVIADGVPTRGIVDYVLGGSVQAARSKLRVNVKLIEAGSGKHLWTDQYEHELGEPLAIQSDIVGHVASAVGGLSGRIPQVERLRLRRKPPSDLQAYELTLLGYELEERFEKQSTLRAFDLLQRAVELDPTLARAWLVLAWTCWQIVQEKWADDTETYRELEREAFLKAVALDPLDSLAVMELAAVRTIDGDAGGARDALERALDLGRNQSDLLVAVSRFVATVMDDPHRALGILDRGLLLNARGPAWHAMTGARVAYFAGDFGRALEDALRGPDNLPSLLFAILALAQLGDREAARDRARVFEARYPEFDPEQFMKDHPITAASARRIFLEGIGKAGLH